MARSVCLAVVAVALLVMLSAAPQPAEAIACGRVVQYLSTCIPYARGKGQLTSSCCQGVKSLNAAARTTADRRDACRCLKTTIAGLKQMNPTLVSGIPRACGVSVPYPISTAVDCAKVQ